MPVKLGKVGKQRSKGAAKKRLRTTGTGKIVMQKAAHNHLLLQKSKRQKNKADKPIMLCKGDSQRMSILLSLS